LAYPIQRVRAISETTSCLRVCLFFALLSDDRKTDRSQTTVQQSLDW